MSRFWVLAAAAALMAGPAVAADAEQFRIVAPGEALTVRADRAYLVLRAEKPFHRWSTVPLLMRVPTPAENEAYEQAKRAAFDKAGKRAGSYEQFAFNYKGAPNLFSVPAKRAHAVIGSQWVLVMDVQPGTYVVYGYGFSDLIAACFCLGSVGFDAVAGQVTDLGTIFLDRADKPSPFPELASEAGLGPTAAMDFVLGAGAVRPVRPSDPLPAGIAALKPVAARYAAVGPWVDGNSPLVNRLAAIPGVLRYDGGRVIDVASGQEAKPR